MLYELFRNVLNMGIVSSVVIIAVIIARGFIGKVSPKYAYILWALVGVRLVCPVSIESSYSIFNIVGSQNQMQIEKVLLGDSVKESVNYALDTNHEKGMSSDKSIDYESGTKYNEKAKQKLHSQSDNGILSEKTLTENTLSANSDSVNLEGNGTDSTNLNENYQNVATDGFNSRESQKITFAAMMDSIVRYGTVVWMIGMAVLLLWNVILYINMKRNVQKAVRLRDHIYECENIATPFVLGIIVPKIYIPFRLESKEQHWILCHEEYHLKRHDNLVKLLAFLITCVYWFHPLVWIAYILMIRDMEMSCDEHVLRSSKEDIRKVYSESLLGFAMNQRSVGVGMLSFGESDVRKRVEHIMKYKKYGKWPAVVALLVIALIGVTCLTDAKSMGKNDRENNQDVSAEASKLAESDEAVKTEAQATKDNILSMETLLKLSEEGKLGSLTYSDYLAYENSVHDKDLDEDVLNSYIHFDLEYNNISYRLDVSYVKENQKIDALYLQNKETKESRCIYSTDSFFQMYATSVKEFVNHENLMDSYISYTLPEGTTTGKGMYDLISDNEKIGQLILDESDRKNGVKGCMNTMVWSSAGGISWKHIMVDPRKELPYISTFQYEGNGRYAPIGEQIKTIPGGELQKVSGCEGTASIQGLEIAKSALVGDYVSYLEPEDGAESALPKSYKKLMPKKIWVGCIIPEDFVEYDGTTSDSEDTGRGAVFFLDAERYSRKDMEEILRSVKFK